jgi:hypothetical protein
MSEIRTAPIISALLSKGFVKASGNRDHQYFFFYYHGKKTDIFTRISHGGRTVDDWLAGKMAHQLRLSKRDFSSFVECTLGGAEYARLMVERGEV